MSYHSFNIVKGCHWIGSLFFFLLLTTLSACNMSDGPKSDSLHQAWFTTKLVSSEGLEMSDYNYRVIRFFEDGTYMLLGNGGFENGMFFHSEKNKTIALQPDTSTLENLPAFLAYTKEGNKIKAVLYRKASLLPGTEEYTMYLEGFGKPGPNDPFSPALHVWQQQPTAPEPLNAIKKRAINYLHFLEALYQYLLDNKVDAISTQWFAQPLLMNYSNGVRMAYADELEKWNKCFYDSAQAVKGYQYLSGALSKITLSKTENRFERNLDCIKQMIQIISNTELLKE
jgi:hypothetical protein